MGYLNIFVKEVVFLKARWTNENNPGLRFKKSKFSSLLTVRLWTIYEMKGFVWRGREWNQCTAVLSFCLIRIHLAMLGTWVWSMVSEDLTCHGATKPVEHKYWACALEHMSWNCWSSHTLEPVLCNRRSHCSEKFATRSSPQLEKARLQQWRPSAAKIN